MGNLTYVSFDPGGSRVGARTVGMVAWDELGSPLRMEQFNWDELQEFLVNLLEVKDTLKTVIVEEYRVFDSKLAAHRWSKLETAQCIGIIKFAAKTIGAQVVEQPSSILSVAEKWSGTKIPTNHDQSHQVSAYLHGYYYLHKHGIIKARVFERRHSKLDGAIKGSPELHLQDEGTDSVDREG